jgi:hypothetical protein
MGRRRGFIIRGNDVTAEVAQQIPSLKAVQALRRKDSFVEQCTTAHLKH